MGNTPTSDIKIISDLNNGSDSGDNIVVVEDLIKKTSSGDLNLNLVQTEISSINFSINEIIFNVNPIRDSLEQNSKLVDFIRDVAHLKGTKAVCRQGRCGACIVLAKTSDGSLKAVNSCLVPLYSIDGWSISTIESMGNFKNGFHQLQNRLVEAGGSQCGYCSPGMIMNMHGFLQTGPKSKIEIENALDGNICRCTGYRPILEAFASFGNGKVDQCSEKVDPACSESDCCSKFGKIDLKSIEVGAVARAIHLKFISGQEWIRPLNFDQFFKIVNHLGPQRYQVINGGTALGNYIKNEFPIEILVDISEIAELKQIEISENQMIIGASITVGELIEILKKVSQFRNFPYASQLILSLSRFAGSAVRNRATLGGNLMVKYGNHGFPSDLFTILESIGCTISIYSAANLRSEVSLENFLGQPMAGKILTSISFPPMFGNFTTYFKSWKISQRYENDAAIVNCAFSFKFTDQMVIADRPSIVYGGVSPNFVHARTLENFLVGKSLKSPDTLKEAFVILEKEIQPNASPNLFSPGYRRQLSLNLFYKFILSLFGNNLNPKLISGGQDIPRLLTTSVQKYQPGDKKNFPIGLPINKIESLSQVSGGVQFINDIPSEPQELFGAFVLSGVGNAVLSSIDISGAMAVPGVVDFISAKDVPGKNSCVAHYDDLFPLVDEEEIFAIKKIQYSGQAIGLVLATSRDAAYEGVRMVKVSYNEMQPNILIFKEDQKNYNENSITGIDAPTQPSGQIKGEFTIGSQLHFPLETCVCLVVPREDQTLEIWPSTQYMALTHKVISGALAIPASSILLHARKLGGSFGLKVSKSAHISVACAIAAWKTQRPVRIHLDHETNSKLIGKRAPAHIKYEGSYEPNTGKILTLSASLTTDHGSTENEALDFYSSFFYQSCYKADTWSVNYGRWRTNTAPNTYVRSPASKESLLMTEYIMENIAKNSALGSIRVRLANMINDGDTTFPFQIPFGGGNSLPNMIQELLKTSDYQSRKNTIDQFNKDNRWKKRGLGFTCQRFPVALSQQFDFPAVISVYHQDGSVAVSHSVFEMGQGIHTKVVQVTAQTLGVPLEKIKIINMNSGMGPNGGATAGSLSSNITTYTVRRACQMLLAKMEPVRKKLGGQISWEKLVEECWKEHIDLNTTYKTTQADALTGYNSWGCIVTEVEIDVLTGENKISRVDVLEDAGASLNPKMDIGQIEGGLIMGFGHLLTEKILYNPETGELLTNDAHSYKVPMSRDIPEDFRVTLWKNNEKFVKGTLGAKSVGEAPVCLSTSVIFAIRNAIESARQDTGATFEYFRIDTPISCEDIVRYCLTNNDQLTI